MPTSSFVDRLRQRIVRLRAPLATMAIIAVVAIALISTSHLVDEVSYDEVMAALRATQSGDILWAIVLTAASFAALTIYDLSALRHVGRKVPFGTVATTSFCAYAVGNTAGFGPLTAGAIRYRFYTPYGLEPEDVGKIIAFVTATFGLGLAAASGLGFVFAANDIPALPLPPSWLRILGIVILTAIAGLVILSARQGQISIRGRSVRLPSPGTLALQLGAALIDLSASGAVLWALLPDADLSLPGFIAVYAVAVGLGVLSHVPAGLGVFETVIIAAVGKTADLDQVLGALVLYRLVYHLLPLVLAALIVTMLEIRRALARPLMSNAIRIGAQLSPPVLGTLTLVVGALQIFSGVTPTGDQPLTAMESLLPLGLVEGSHFLASVLGLVLLVAARGLVYRLDGAWWSCVTLLPVAMLLSLLKGMALGEASLLAVLLAALLATKGEFDRHASLTHQALTTNWIMAVATLLMTAGAILFFVYKDVDYANELWWQFEFSQNAPRSLRALMGVALMGAIGAAWMLLRPARSAVHPATTQELAQAADIIAAQDRTDAQLALMGDKSLMFSDDGRAFIMYGRQGRSWMALFDPVGPRDCWPGLIWRFVETARAQGGRAAFYQVGPEHLSLYADAGLGAFKLGEEARIDLATFDLKGSKRSNLRNTLNRGDRDGMIFSILSADQVPAHLDQLRAVSDDWLAAHNVREKRFSLGAFLPDYLIRQPVAVLRLHDENGPVVAFASLLTTGQKAEASIDLMRFSGQAPAGCMEYLLLRLIQGFKDQGYSWFNLGMAPLSGLSESEAAPVWHRVGRAVFDHGEHFYNFAGLRQFKAKFSPQWQPRYLAVSGGLNPMLALADVTVLISGGIRGVVGK